MGLKSEKFERVSNRMEVQTQSRRQIYKVVHPHRRHHVASRGRGITTRRADGLCEINWPDSRPVTKLVERASEPIPAPGRCCVQPP
jgi:hypothetical protein